MRRGHHQSCPVLRLWSGLVYRQVVTRRTTNAAKANLSKLIAMLERGEEKALALGIID
jgi:hypothetical protein